MEVSHLFGLVFNGEVKFRLIILNIENACEEEVSRFSNR